MCDVSDANENNAEDNNQKITTTSLLDASKGGICASLYKEKAASKKLLMAMPMELNGRSQKGYVETGNHETGDRPKEGQEHAITSTLEKKSRFSKTVVIDVEETQRVDYTSKLALDSAGGADSRSTNA
jgi:hypothetical protein